MATALVHGNAKTERMVTFGPDEHPRSLQVYGSDPVMMGRAVDRVCGAGLVDHIDLNFGCPAAKVTRKGGGAAVPAKPALLRAIVRAAVAAAAPYGVPVTAKFRIGLHDGLLTHLRAGEICADEGVVAIAVHARTVEQHYAGDARWEAIGELKAARHVDPGARQRRHLGGRRRRRDDGGHRAATASSSGAAASAGRGCSATCSRCSPAARRRRRARSGVAADGDGRPRRAPCVDHHGRRSDSRPCGRSASTPRGTSPATRSAARLRRRFAQVSTLAELDDLVAGLDPR